MRANNYYCLVSLLLVSLLASSYRKIAAAVAGSIAHMNPAEIVLVDGLVNRQVELAKQPVETLVLVLGAGGDVGGFAQNMLTCRYTAHRHVESRAAVAAVHMDGRSPCLAQRVEDILDESGEVVNHLLRRCVVDAPQPGSSGAGKLRDSKIVHDSSQLTVHSSQLNLPQSK